MEIPNRVEDLDCALSCGPLTLFDIEIVTQLALDVTNVARGD
jgi:hypothetical protein